MRFNLIVRDSNQYKYLIIIVVAMIIPAIVVGSFLYYFMFSFTAESIGMPEAVITNLIPVINKINLMLTIGLIPFFSLIVLLGLVLSHRFYGPLRRIERDIDEIISGNHMVHFKVRKGDDVESIVSKLNTLAEMVRSRK